MELTNEMIEQLKFLMCFSNHKNPKVLKMAFALLIKLFSVLFRHSDGLAII